MYRVHTIDNEQFLVRVDKLVIEEWLTVREANQNLGYPDRPPDINTKKFRAWVCHYGESGYLESFKKSENPSKDISFPVYAYVVSTYHPFLAKVNDFMVVKIIVSWEGETNEYVLRMVARSDRTGDTFFDKSQSLVGDTDEELNLDFQTALEILTRDLPSESVMVSTYDEFFEQSFELDLAQQELEEYYKTNGIPPFELKEDIKRYN